MKAGSLCYKDETIVFSAAVKGNDKLVSICSSRKLDESEGYLQYRFGRPEKIELCFPESRKDTQSQFQYSRYTRPLVTYLTLKFEINRYRYSIHEDYDAERKPERRESYITVTPPGGDSEEVRIQLHTPVKGDLAKLEYVVPNTR
jgi:hypothetical protein